MKRIIQNSKNFFVYDTNLTLSGILVIVFSLTINECVEKYWKGHSANHFPHPICFFVLFSFARELRTQDSQRYVETNRRISWIAFFATLG